MADKKISELTALLGSGVSTSVDLAAIVDMSASETKKITIRELFNSINILSTNSSTTTASDYFLTFDSSASEAKKTLIPNASTTVTGISRLATSTETISGVSDTISVTPSADAAALAVVKNPLAMAQGVDMTYAASGSSGIAVADDADLNFGTGDFTLVWRGSVPDYDLSLYRPLITKSGPAPAYVNYRLYLGSAGSSSKIELVLQEYIATSVSTITSTVTHTLVDGTISEICAVINNTTQTVTFYLNGIQFGEPVSYTSGWNVSNSGNLYLSGTDTIRTASRTHAAILYNRALSATDVMSLYRNGIAFADMWGSQTAVYTSDFSADANGWADYSNTVITGNIDSIGGEDNCLRAYASAVAGVHQFRFPPSAVFFPQGKSLRITFKYYIPSGNTNLKKVRLYAGSAAYWTDITTGSSYSSFLSETDSWETVSLDLVYPAAIGQLNFGMSTESTESFTGAGVNTDDLFYIKDVVVTQTGATAAYLPENIQPAPGQWLDASSNKLHALQPASGSSLVRSKTTFEFRWTNTWTASTAMQYIGGSNQVVLTTRHFITEIISKTTETTDVENIQYGDGSDDDYYVTSAAAGTSAVPVIHTLAKNLSDGTNLDLSITPAAEATMTVETIVRGFLLEP